MSQHRKPMVQKIDRLFFGDGEVDGLDNLITDGWIEPGDNPGFGPAAGAALGISAERQSLWWAIVGPAGQLAADRVEMPIAPVTGSAQDRMKPAEFLSRLTEVLRAVRERMPGVRLAGAAIAWPCAIGLGGEPAHYRIHHEEFAKAGFSLRATVRDALVAAGFQGIDRDGEEEGSEIEVDVINDADADLLYESRWGVARDVRDAIGVKLCGGIGGAVLVHRRILTGHDGGAGEIEHIPVRYEEVPIEGKWANVKKLGELEPCWCGGMACIERFASGRAIIDTLEDYGERANDYYERGLLIEKEGSDGRVQAVFERAGKLLGHALEGPILAFDPACIVVTAFPRNDSLLVGLRQALPRDSKVEVKGTTPVGWTTAAGAARLVVEQRIIPRMEASVLPGDPAPFAGLPSWLRQMLPPDRPHELLRDGQAWYRPDASR